MRIAVVFAGLLVAALQQQPSSQTPWTGRVLVPAGFEITPPAGWIWTSLRWDEVTFQGGETSLTIAYTPDGPTPDFCRLETVATLADGAAVAWCRNQMGGTPHAWPYIVRDSRHFAVGLGFGVLNPDPARWKDLLSEFARALRIVRRTQTLRHPTLPVQIDILNREIAPSEGITSVEVNASGLVVTCAQSEPGTHPTIAAYPVALPNRPELAQPNAKAYLEGRVLDAARRGIRYGPVKALQFPGYDEAAWAAAPGTTRPYLAVVIRGGRYFIVEARTYQPLADPSPLWPAFLKTLSSVRP